MLARAADLHIEVATISQAAVEACVTGILEEQDGRFNMSVEKVVRKVRGELQAAAESAALEQAKREKRLRAARMSKERSEAARAETAKRARRLSGDSVKTGLQAALSDSREPSVEHWTLTMT
eukprot:jgi/Ulvmu1/11506/UM077_0055.1